MAKGTFWVHKSGEGYFPLSPIFVKETNIDGCVTDVTEALGEEYEDKELLLKGYSELDKRMEEQGFMTRFTKGLLENFEPKIIEMTDEQYKKWHKNLKLLEGE